jgi:hypothetical protein
MMLTYAGFLFGFAVVLMIVAAVRRGRSANKQGSMATFYVALALAVVSFILLIAYYL